MFSKKMVSIHAVLIYSSVLVKYKNLNYMLPFCALVTMLPLAVEITVELY